MSENTVPAFEVRQAASRDLPAIRAFLDSILQEHGVAHEFDDLENLDQFYFKRGGDFQVVVSGKGKSERVLGTVAMLPRAPYTCELRHMALAPELRGQGLGKYLMDQALGRARAQGFREVELATASAFEQANGLYRRFGFYPKLEKQVPREDSGRFFDQALSADL